MAKMAESKGQPPIPSVDAVRKAPTVFVAAVAITCGKRILAVHNSKWGAFTLPMTKQRPGELWNVAATRAAAECTGKLFLLDAGSHKSQNVQVDSTMWPAPVGLKTAAAFMQGDRDGIEKSYLFQVFGLAVDREFSMPPGLVGAWLAADEFLDDRISPISRTARFLIEGLARTARDQGRTFPDKGVKWLYTLRKSTGAWALASRTENGERQWLARWNRNWRSFGPVGGHKEARESFRECLIREIGEELRLEEGSDFSVPTKPRGHLEFEEYSVSSRKPTDYMMEVFDVTFTASGIKKMETEPRNTRWVSESEIRGEKCADGKPVSHTMALLLDMVGWQ